MQNKLHCLVVIGFSGNERYLRRVPFSLVMMDPGEERGRGGTMGRRLRGTTGLCDIHVTRELGKRA